MVTEPNHSQHKDIGKLSVNVSKLEEATFEALSSWFADVDHPNNAKKRPCLKEIFRVAKYQERFKNGEIGSSNPSCHTVRSSSANGSSIRWRGGSASHSRR